MIRLIPVAALLASLLPAQKPANKPANKPSQADLQTMRTEKLAKPVFQAANWLTDYDKARATAKQEGKLLFVYFTRSYAN